MDNTEDDCLSNLSWLKVSTSSELQSAVECSTNYIDDDLQCLCWVVKMRPKTSSSHSLKRLSSTTNRDKHQSGSNRLLPSSYISDQSSNTATNETMDTASTNYHPTSRRILMVRTLNNSLSPTKSYQNSFVLIRSSNGKISCLSIRHFV